MSSSFGSVYKKLVIKDDKLIGACLYGDTVDGHLVDGLAFTGLTLSATHIKTGPKRSARA